MPKEISNISLQEQLQSWVEGISIHNQNGCCPDFSCCKPSLLAPIEVRKIFYNAHLTNNEPVKGRLLMEFLGKVISTATVKKVHIAGQEISRREII